MKNQMNLLLSACFLLTGLSANAQGQAACPKMIILKGASFINHQSLPNPDQIETNFRNVLVDLHGTPVWNQSDLTSAEQFVNAIRSKTRNNQIVLTPVATKNGCVGTFENIAYEVGAPLSINFKLSEENGVEIQMGKHAAVNFTLNLPSNCSNCGDLAELFEFQQVSSR